MSAAALATDVAPTKKGKKKLIIVAAVVALLVAAGAGFMVMKARAAHADDEDEVEVAHVQKSEKHEAHDPKHPPIYVPLEVITCNLADRDTDRYAQVSIALEVDDSKAGEQIKAFMPIIRHNILMVLSSKSSDDVRSEAGKKFLLAELKANVLRPLGYDFDPEELMEEDGEAKPAKGKGKRKVRLPRLPVKAVHFINFIVQ
jgi:flagellar FliL protein